MSNIRNISQTVQEREIIKTAPDLVVFIDGLPYLTNFYIGASTTGQNKTLVNFNDHVTAFSASYDTEAMVPNCSVSLSVPNYQKYLYQMPGGNNLIQTMAQIQVYAKSYFMASTGDTVYRRVFKGITSYIGYVDNGKTLDITIQCHGSLHLLEKMQVNIHPSANTAHKTAESQTIFQSRYASGDCFSIIAMAFLDGLRSDQFQISSLKSASMTPGNPYYDAITKGYMAKWQAILWNMVKDVHVYGSFKDTLGDTLPLKRSSVSGDPAKMKAAASITKLPAESDSTKVDPKSGNYNQYYGNILKYLPFRNITSLDLTNNVIVNRLDVIREVTRKIDFEAYQDIDGKIIIKPPLYNLDVVNLGPQTGQTQTLDNSSRNSLTNPSTAIHPQSNPFVVYLSEILTEQENEDQSAIRRTRTTVSGNAMRELGNNMRDDIKAIGEFIDISKLAKFGLREEPTYQVPWLDWTDKYALFTHAAAETARANRGYRTYSFTIPMRPELKLGFPVYIPHRDFYAYIKSISINYQVGGTATMSVTCDSIRRRVLIATKQTRGTGNSQKTELEVFTPAPNLIYQWTKNPPQDTQITDPSQSPSNSQYWGSTYSLLSSGPSGGVSNDQSNPTDLVGTSVTVPTPGTNYDKSKTGPTAAQEKVYSNRSETIGSRQGNQPSTPLASYVVRNDGDPKGTPNTINPATKAAYFPDTGLPANKAYIDMICGNEDTHTNSVMPFTDTKGYEVIAPFPWGRWQNLIDALREFTEQGWIVKNTDVNGNNSQSLADLQTIANTDAFIFAGLGTPTATSDPSTQIQQALSNQIGLIGGDNTASVAASGTVPSAVTSPQAAAKQKFNFQPDATVIVLHYDPSKPSSFADNSLLNGEQPENKFAAAALPNTQTINQQIVDVLVSGEVSPVPAVQEALLATQTQLPNGSIIKIVHPIPSKPGK